jgi:glycosyltransferase involved in cell wall biosynthesis
MNISVVIPAYNEEKHLPGLLESLALQTYKPYEIIVVDNRSTDKTAEVAHTFPGVRVVHEPIPGVVNARARGAQEATGEIIANIDADCLPDSNWLKHGVTYFENDETVVAVSGPYDYYDAREPMRSISRAIQKSVYLFVHIFVHNVLDAGAIMIGGNEMIRKSAIEKMGGYDTSIFFYGEDTDTAKRLSRVGKVLFKNNMMMQSSARRFKKMGVITVAYLYIMNFFWVTFLGKPYSKE